LDFIVLKALRKDASRRYQTVAEFAEDIERFLQNLPVKAAPDGFVYRARKFVKRHNALSPALLAAELLIIFFAPLVYWVSQRNPSNVALRKDKARRLTFNLATDNYPHFLPDGRIYFERIGGAGETQFFTINADGADERLLDIKFPCDRAVFSPDGKKIVFRGTENYRLYVTDSDSIADAHQITRFRAGRPAWSPDGKQIAFSYNFSEDVKKNTQPFYRERDNVEIFTVNSDGANEKEISNSPTFDSDASFSSDGKQIAFNSDRDGNFQIYLMNADGSNQRRLSRNEFDERLPAFAPDNRHIAFTSNRDGNEEIYIMETDGSHPHRLTFALGDDCEAAWSADGKQIVFKSGSEGNDEIFIIDVPPEILAE
jgi:Tol biopolymer transport system component